MNIFAHNKHQQSGFSLIEVLVTMLIVGVGLMGLIALMVKGMQASSGSAMRSIASAQAYDMADRMRANINGVIAGDYSNIVPPGSTTTCPLEDDDLVEPADPDDLEACVGANMAGKDKCAWHLANANRLPSGAGAICKEATENWYSIHLAWDDGKTGAPTIKFVLRFEP